ncbi:hypothetical protein Desaci_2468 [Desulfosporosinus acidiphilus SJ4]|uniref:Uncharacterized protein n=1 Tax=Desulfosporosinus acidiphilus (strain DSM 22704 / JCM 16185 / SJ4) TaxID=646529 RepID=I4D6J2_DESAJ|nr:hypothetical protein [Desulfosporosinus acidiphilus]AFM41416.1 hypothetical protein Desaci_2468 [Desulfosporosinus acidiphilus SJ4]
MQSQNRRADVTETWRNVVNQISQVPFWGSPKTLLQGTAETMDKEYRQEVLKLIEDFSEKMYAFRHQGTLVIAQFMESPPKNFQEGVQRSKNVQARMSKIAADISKIEFPNEVIVKGKKYNIKNEQGSINEIKDNFVKGFTLTSKGYDYVPPYIAGQNTNALNQMRASFRKADENFLKGIFDLEALKAKYSEPTGNNNIKTFN